MMTQHDALTLSRFQNLLNASIQHCFQEHHQKPSADQELRCICSTFREPLISIEENLFTTETNFTDTDFGSLNTFIGNTRQLQLGFKYIY